MADFDIVVGIHSIGCALLNKKRKHRKIVFTEEGQKELLKRTDINNEFLNNISTELVSPHKLQEYGKQYFLKKKLEFQRIPSQCFLGI